LAEKLINGRIQHKHDVEANWIKATNFAPKEGELIIYDADGNYSYPRIKIGDGSTNVNDLPFTTSGNLLKATVTGSWTGNTAPYTQTITVNGISASSTPNISPVLTGVLATDNTILNAWDNVYRITTGNNSITVYSYTPFTTTFGLNIYVGSRLEVNTSSLTSTATLGTSWTTATASTTPSTTYCKYYQKVTVPGVTATNNAVMSIAGTATDAQRTAAMKAEMFVYSQGVDSVTVCIPSSGILPTVSIPIQVVIME